MGVGLGVKIGKTILKTKHSGDSVFCIKYRCALQHLPPGKNSIIELLLSTAFERCAEAIDKKSTTASVKVWHFRPTVCLHKAQQN
jgi:hypothetical protein